ncbi:MAG: (2Fe-2S)-binding protein [Ignavibacteriales bacterium]|nr:(2Fe-2S)-binding protein [Ignavibacteriales bacterium]
MSSFTLTVNGKKHTVDVDPDTPLLWVLRDSIGLTGTKYGCGQGYCGSCTVHVDGEAIRSCTMAIESLSDKKVTTIEGLSPNSSHPIQQAWIAHDVPQCGYCQSGQIMAAAALLSEKPDPNDEDINASMNLICRCGTYNRIREAVHVASENMRKKELGQKGGK